MFLPPNVANIGQQALLIIQVKREVIMSLGFSHLKIIGELT